MIAPHDFLRDFPARPTGDLVNAVIEIPTGATDKWEVGLDGVMRWDMKNGQPRRVRYLGYPANYGIVPRAVLGTEIGGDGDPLDILVLGPARPRGSIVPVVLLGTIRLVDDGEKDDKILAVAADSPMAECRTPAALDAAFPGITAILRTWFQNYKGPGALTCSGFGTADEAAELVTAACRSFEESAAARQ